MFDYSLLQFIFAVYFMLIFAGFTSAIGWCDPAEYKKRPVLLVISIIFFMFSIFALIKAVSICTSVTSPDDSTISAFSSLFDALYDGLGLQSSIQYAEDQIGTLVFSGVFVVFILVAFLLSFVFTFVLAFRIALRIDLNLKNTTRYVIMGFCIALTLIAGIVTSQIGVMFIFLIYSIIAFLFLIIGNMRLAEKKKSAAVNKVDE